MKPPKQTSTFTWIIAIGSIAFIIIVPVRDLEIGRARDLESNSTRSIPKAVASVKTSQTVSSIPRTISYGTLNCRWHPDADRYTTQHQLAFNDDMTSVYWTTNLKNLKPLSLKIKKIGKNMVLNGVQTRIDIDGNKTEHPDTDMFIITEKPTGYWNLEVYYFESFETDPVSIIVCHKN